MVDRLIDITEKVVTTSRWQFSRVGGNVVTEALCFLPDGRLRGYDHPNECAWAVSEGHLCFLREDGMITTVFDTRLDLDGRLALQGSFVGDPAIINRLVRQNSWLQFGKSTRFELAGDIARYGWKIGDHTYGVPLVFEAGQAALEIGKFTSIASGVSIALSNHDTRNVSCYPFVTLRAYWSSVPPSASDHSTHAGVTIGNDVWIGVNAFIGPGVHIGDGAVVGAHSVVTRDVPAYATVAGSPARVLHHRFEQDTIESLLAVRWWDWPDEVVDSFLPLIISHDIRAFLEAARRWNAAAQAG